jgi:hypothetical protein
VSDAAITEASRLLRDFLDERAAAIVQSRVDDGEQWTLPHVGDFVCVFIVEDAGEDSSAVYQLNSHGPSYRPIGLLQQALMDYAGDIVRDGAE